MADYKIEVLYKYLQENRLIHDLVERGIFSLDEKQHLTKKWENAGEKLTVGDQKDAFIRFQVDGVDLWEDTKLQENYIHYYLSNGRRDWLLSGNRKRRKVMCKSPF